MELNLEDLVIAESFAEEGVCVNKVSRQHFSGSTETASWNRAGTWSIDACFFMGIFVYVRHGFSAPIFGIRAGDFDGLYDLFKYKTTVVANGLRAEVAFV